MESSFVATGFITQSPHLHLLGMQAKGLHERFPQHCHRAYWVSQELTHRPPSFSMIFNRATRTSSMTEAVKPSQG
jgi:hypothetical protein